MDKAAWITTLRDFASKGNDFVVSASEANELANLLDTPEEGDGNATATD